MPMDMFSLAGRTAVVLGGTGVLGQALAAGLTRAGARVAITGRSQDRVDAVVQSGRAAVGRRLDVARAEQLEAVAAELSPVDILVNAIGGNVADATTSSTTSFFDIPASAWQNVVDVNLLQGAVLPCQSFGRHMTGEGVIILISSMAAFKPLTRVPGYAAAKAAVSNFTQWLAVDMARATQGRLRVNAIAPGFFLTDQNRHLLTDVDSGDLTARGRTVLDHTPMGRFGQPDDLIGTVVWLASDAARFVTGVVVPVDGGFQAYGGV